jgi:hypothetical protein
MDETFEQEEDTPISPVNIEPTPLSPLIVEPTPLTPLIVERARLDPPAALLVLSRKDGTYSDVPSSVVPAKTFCDVATQGPTPTAFECVRMSQPQTDLNERRLSRDIRAFLFGFAVAAAIFLGALVSRRYPRPELTASIGMLLRAPPAPAPRDPVHLMPPLVELPGPMPPPTAAQERATLSIATTPPGAAVRIDDQLRGYSPLVLALTRGAHEVVLERSRYAPTRVEAHAPGRIDVYLQRPPAVLRVLSTPEGATVHINGRLVGQTPLQLNAAGFKRYIVELELDGRTTRRRVYLRPPQAVVDVALISQP